MSTSDNTSSHKKEPTMAARMFTLTPRPLGALWGGLKHDLARLQQDLGSLEGVDYYMVTIDEHADLLYVSPLGRAGIAWGADPDWTYAESPEDAVERYLGLGDKAMED
jgi:hypothetical protein